jgi:hypothetical protein
MRPSCGYRLKSDLSRHGDRRGDISGTIRVIAELHCDAGAPTIGCSGGCERTVVILPYRKCGKGDPVGHGDRYGNAAIGRGAITQLTIVIISPTIHRTRSREGTAMHNTRTNRCKGHPSGHRNGHRSVAIRCRTVTECATLITSPTVSITRTVEGTAG